VRVPRHRISSFNAGELVLVLAAHEKSSSPGSVNVKPDPVALADVCNSLNGVKGAKDGGAGRAVDEEGEAALRLVLQHSLLKLLRDHPALFIAHDLDTVVGAEADG